MPIGSSPFKYKTSSPNIFVASSISSAVFSPCLFALVLIMGNYSDNLIAVRFSGILIPSLPFRQTPFGNSVLALKINVNGPGTLLLIIFSSSFGPFYYFLIHFITFLVHSSLLFFAYISGLFRVD